MAADAKADSQIDLVEPTTENSFTGYNEEDDTWGGFFRVGRDFEPSNVTHKFTAREKERMAEFQSSDYRRSIDVTYKEHLEHTDEPSAASKWATFALIGGMAGLVAFLLKETIELLNNTRFEAVRDLLRDSKLGAAWGVTMAHSVGLVFISSVLVVLIEPAAAGSGVPDVMGYLNGVHIKKVFNIRTACVKFFSALAAVSSGLPVGPEGPMIHLGASIGAGLSQGRSKTLGWKSSMFQQFRNTRDKRDFITGGAAAGVSAAFGAPVGGLLFAMEEVASYWNQSLTWMIFFGTMMSTFIVNLFTSAFEEWEYSGNFGFWDDNATILFHVDSIVRFSAASIPVVIVIGVIGGGLGAIFTFINLKVTKFRGRTIVPRSWLRVVEPMLVMVIFGTLMLMLPQTQSCRADITSFSANNATVVIARDSVRLDLNEYDCGSGMYNEFATLSLSSGDETIRHLFSRGTSGRFGYTTLFVYLAIYFVFACYIAGSAISSGLVVPMLVIGATYGRIVGLFMVDLFGADISWIDPGVFALIGAASFFGGVSRLTISLTVIMVEISNEIHLLLPIMLGIMVAKWVADFATHSLYHALLEIKCVPFLDQRVVVPKTDLFTASDIMNSPVVCLPQVARVRDVLSMLDSCKHHGFPVVLPPHAAHKDDGGAAEMKESEDHVMPASGSWFYGAGKNTGAFKGIVLRSQLDMVLRHPEYFVSSASERGKHLSYSQIVIYKEQLHARKHSNPLPPLRTVVQDQDLDRFVDIAPYTNISAFSVPADFSIRLTYTLFRAMSLRHLTVVNFHNEVIGMITRKDLLGQTIEERVDAVIAKRAGQIRVTSDGHE